MSKNMRQFNCVSNLDLMPAFKSSTLSYTIESDNSLDNCVAPYFPYFKLRPLRVSSLPIGQLLPKDRGFKYGRGR